MKFYNIEVILYNEEEYKRIIKKINEDTEWASAVHDKDIIEETGEIKKTHIHLQIYNKIQKSLKSWAKYLEIEENRIEIIRNKVKAIRYLIHKDNLEKYQYEENIIESNFNIKPYFKTKDQETNELKTIIEYIKNWNGIIKLSYILEYALENNIWSTYRRNYSIIKDFILEKNELTQQKINDILKS